MGLHLLYGGTFDPVHLGHLAVARAALAATDAERLDFIPAADPPHRAVPGARFEQRLAMLQAAVADAPAPEFGEWGIDPCESERSGPSYTVDTLRTWRQRHGGDRPLGFVLGADAFLGLATWHVWSSIPELAHLVVAVRPGSPLDRLPPALSKALEGRWTTDARRLGSAPAGHVFVLELPPRPESATAARAAAGGEGLAPLLPTPVADYIRRHGLYGAAPAP